MYNPYFYELVKAQQREGERKAERERLVAGALQLRRRVRQASAVPEPAVARCEPVERPEAVSIGR